jgi:hypothetical protein
MRYPGEADRGPVRLVAGCDQDHAYFIFQAETCNSRTVAVCSTYRDSNSLLLGTTVSLPPLYVIVQVRIYESGLVYAPHLRTPSLAPSGDTAFPFVVVLYIHIGHYQRSVCFPSHSSTK